MNLKFMGKNKMYTTFFALLATAVLAAQEPNIPDESEMADATGMNDSTLSGKKVKIDGVAAVIGDYVILNSDVEKTLIDLRSQGASTEDITHCQLLGKLMEDRLYAHQAVQDSLLVSDDQVNATSDRQIQQLTAQIGSVEKVLKFYKKPDLESFRKELFEINKLRMLSEKMQSKIVEDVQVTPEEVRQFFLQIP